MKHCPGNMKWSRIDYVPISISSWRIYLIMACSFMRMTNLDKVRQLSRDDRSLLFQAVLLLPAIHVALLLLGYSRLHGMMRKLIPVRAMASPISEVEVLLRAQKISRIVSIAAQHGLYKATCLRKSLLAWWLLQKEGIQSEMCFGVQRVNRHLVAHAWVEYKGMVLNDSTNVREQYQALHDALPSTRVGL